MDSVEKKLGENFARWRTENNRNDNEKAAIEKDIEKYMLDTFQIQSEEKPVNILDILDTMIAPDVEASVAANGVRKNVFACKDSGQTSNQSNATPGRNKRAVSDICQNAEYSCSNKDFVLYGSQCFYLSTSEASRLNFSSANTACGALGAELATFTDLTGEHFVDSLYNETEFVWIGLNDIELEGTFVWQDGSIPTYSNWGNHIFNDDQNNCVLKRPGVKKWKIVPCYANKRYVCSMYAQRLCFSTTTATTTATITTTITTKTTTTTTSTDVLAIDPLVALVVKNAVNEQNCIQLNNDEQVISNSNTGSKLPNVDVFLNPAKQGFKEKVVKEKKEIAENYFSTVDMQSLYPELFRILWESTLPCFGTPESKDHMLLSCQLAGSEVNCSDLFTKVPTDAGMCCALNSLDSLKSSTYQRLVKELQGDTTTMKTHVKSEVGRRNGLRLTLDLYSNSVSFGTLDQDYEAFNVFIGQPAEFPMMKERGLQVEAGRENFIDLSAVVVSTNDIKDLAPEARECFFADEGNLDFYESYTFSNCRLECAIKKLEEIFKCVPWHLPKV